MEVKIIQGNKSVLGAFHRKVKKLRVAAYCRVSTDDEDQIKSYNSMIKYYTDLIQKNVNRNLLEFMLIRLLQEQV